MNCGQGLATILEESGSRKVHVRYSVEMDQSLSLCLWRVVFGFCKGTHFPPSMTGDKGSLLARHFGREPE